MGELRVPTGIGPVKEASTAAFISQGAAQAPGAGLKKIGQGIGQAGAFFEEFSKRKQSADNQEGRLEFTAIRNAFSAETERNMASLPEERRAGFYEKEMAKFEATEGAKATAKMGQEERENLLGNHNIWKGQTLIRIKTTAAVADIDRKVAVLDTAIDELARGGDVKIAEAEIKAAVANQILTDKQGAAKIKGLKNLSSRHQVVRDTAADPWVTRDNLIDQRDNPKTANHYPGLAPQDIERRIDDTDSAINEHFDGVNKRIDEAIDKNIGSDDKREAVWVEIETLHKGEKISDLEKENMRKSLFNPSDEFTDWPEASKRRSEIKEYNPSADPTGKVKTEMEHVIKETDLDRDMRSTLLSELRSKKEGKRNISRAEKDGFEMIDRWLKSGQLGDIATDSDGVPFDKIGFNEAHTKQMKLYDEADSFWENPANQYATGIDFKTHMRGFVQIETDSSALNEISPVATNPRSVDQRAQLDLTLASVRAAGGPSGFDPLGSGFDDPGAKAAGLKRDSAGHLGSLGQGGLLLKGIKHDTFHLALKEENKRGSQIVQRGNRFFSTLDQGVREGDKIVTIKRGKVLIDGKEISDSAKKKKPTTPGTR